MTAAAFQELVAALRTRGLIPDKNPQAEGIDRPWFVAVLQGVAGWLAGIFLLTFIGLMFKPDSTAAILVVGALLLGGAWALYYADRNAVFLDQLALAISIAGQFAVAWAILKDHFTGLPVAATLLALQLVVLFVMPNKVARTVAATFATIAWVFTIRFLLRPGHGNDLFFDYDNPAVPSVFGAWTVPVGWALTWLPLLALGSWLIRNEAQWMSSNLRMYARPLLTGVLLGLGLGGVDTMPGNLIAIGWHARGVPFSWWALFPLLSVGLALFAAYGAFRVRSAALLGAGVLAALMHLAHFYYLYGTTLLWKSVIMLVVGTAALLAGNALRAHEAPAGSAP
jgi:hypothetical protein